jgi:SAM-dependent methyltransferase
VDYDHLQQIRLFELQRILPYLHPGQTVLELGAGAGWQAKYLAEHGFHVVAIDVVEGNYRQLCVFPVTMYDGQHIPLGSESIDVIFSSNVLEHIPNVEDFQPELQRILKPDGYGIHLMPTTAWRFWTWLTHYPALVRKIAYRLRGLSMESVGITPSPVVGAKPSRIGRLLRLLVEPRHGEVGNTLTELYYFSNGRWTHMFQSTGWRVDQSAPVGLFYTGYSLFGQFISLTVRSRLALVLGSACRIYVVRKAPSAKQL